MDKFVIFLLATQISIILCSCPKGTIDSSDGTMCYQFVGNTPTDFYSADEGCTGNPGNLASISNAFTNAFIASK